MLICSLKVSTSAGIPCLDPTKGERAILIKNPLGDWAIVVGVWTGAKKAKKPKGGKISDISWLKSSTELMFLG